MPPEMDEQVNPLERDHSLCVVLPGGQENNATVHGSKPVMDLLVTVCASYHLNPSDYTVEFLSTNKNNISFKPNSPIGLLDAEKMMLKPRGAEEKIKRPYMPEATVRLLISYNKSNKTVVRVNPRLPLEMLLPAVCDKCGFNTETTILLRDSQSQEPLDLTMTLNDHGLREVFAKDTSAKDPADHRLKTAEGAADTRTEAVSTPPLRELPKNEKKQNNRGFFSLFRRKTKKHETLGAASAPPSPSKQLGVGGNSENIPTTNTLPTDMPKKRRAPQPPMCVSQSVPNNLNTCHVKGAQRSAESTLRSTKRRAPPPPCANTNARDSLNTLEELRESDDSNSVNLSLSSCSSPHPSQTQSSLPSLAHRYNAADSHLPHFRGKDLSDARSALAKVLTSSVSKGTLAKRLRNSAAFTKFHVSSCVSVTPECPDVEDFCTELKSVLKANLPTENEWEVPAENKGLTTFKVVPPKNLISCDVELTDFPDQYQISREENALSEASGNNQETEEDPSSPDPSESENSFHSPEPPLQQIQVDNASTSTPPLHDSDNHSCPETPVSEVGDTTMKPKEEEEPEVTSELMPAAPSDCSNGDIFTESHINPEYEKEFTQSPSADTDQYSSCADERKVEEDVVEAKEEEEEASFPPPPPPVYYTEKDREDPTASSLPYFQPASPASNGHTNAFSDAHNDDSMNSAMSKQSVDSTNVAPSRFAQAVAMAIQRSRLLSFGKGLSPQVSSRPHGTLPSPPRSTYQYGA
ncbi:uncharacterized protein [Leuresthes tenuis]|uniref:uncharacterized protein n=1 Tax=Leuresthes tenuis TaxID=355514 RepID=UPI003B512F74